MTAKSQSLGFFAPFPSQCCNTHSRIIPPALSCCSVITAKADKISFNFSPAAEARGEERAGAGVQSQLEAAGRRDRLERGAGEETLPEREERPHLRALRDQSPGSE